MPSCRNDDFTDREMLANIKDAADGDGWATTTEIGKVCGFSENGEKSRTPATAVASRLAWMRDGGLLESMHTTDNEQYSEHGSKDRIWRLTDVGESILHGKLTKTVENALDRMDAGAQVAMMRELSRRGYVNGSQSVAFALNREFKHHLSKRKLSLRQPR